MHRVKEPDAALPSRPPIGIYYIWGEAGDRKMGQKRGNESKTQKNVIFHVDKAAEGLYIQCKYIVVASYNTIEFWIWSLIGPIRPSIWIVL